MRKTLVQGSKVTPWFVNKGWNKTVKAGKLVIFSWSNVNICIHDSRNILCKKYEKHAHNLFTDIQTFMQNSNALSQIWSHYQLHMNFKFSILDRVLSVDLLTLWPVRKPSNFRLRELPYTYAMLCMHGTMASLMLAFPWFANLKIIHSLPMGFWICLALKGA